MEIENKKITLEQMFIFQVLLEKINITTIADRIINKIKEISIDNYTDSEIKAIEEIEKLDSQDEKLNKLKSFKNSRALRMGMVINAEVRNYIVKNLFKAQIEFKELLFNFLGEEEKEIDINRMMEVFNIMWNNGLHNIAFMYLQDKDIYAKKK
jgi:hypothetical protein